MIISNYKVIRTEDVDYEAEEIVIPDGVKYITSHAFYNFKNLKKVVMPDSVTIGSSAFRRCASLVDINIPNSTTDICRYAFEGCESLKSIIIPEEVEQIGDRAFFGCDKLTIVTINSDSVKFGEKVFRNCESLKSLVIPSNVRFDSSIFDIYASVTINMMYDR